MLSHRIPEVIAAREPAGHPAQAALRTTPGGIIVWMNARAGTLLNITPRAGCGRNLLVFFNGDRGRLQAELAAAAAGKVRDLRASLRPRDRKPLNVRLDLAPGADAVHRELEWTIEPLSADATASPAIIENTESSQVLWHACRAGSPSVTAVLICTADGYELHVLFGKVAHQRVTSASPAAAVERSERLLTRLEACGYRRSRRDTRKT